MTHNDIPERLYSLLPAIYRIRDESQDGSLRSLLSIIESELQLVEQDIENLYENWFIETCDDWVVPYIGNLLAVRELSAESHRTFGQERRAFVANTLAYRQRKGTTPVLEQLARDITGWGARAVESQRLVAATQNVNHVRPQTGTVNLRRIGQSERLGTPFETGVAYTTQIGPSRGGGKYNPNSVILYLWRLQSYLVERGTPRAVSGLDSAQGRYFTFNPLGYDKIPLFNTPQTERDITTLAEEINVPGILTRDLLKAYAPEARPVQVFVKGERQPYQVDDLSNWQSDLTGTLVVDPELGRLAFLSEPPEQVEVTYAYGFSGDIGGGVYERTDAIAQQPPNPGQITWKVNSDLPALLQIVKIWNQYARKWQHCYDLINFPVARLVLSPDQQIYRVDLDNKREERNLNLSPNMRAGILQGLKAIAHLGEIDVVVTPGVAVDIQGRAMRLNVRHSVIVGCYPSQTVRLVIFYPEREWEPHWEIRALPMDEWEQDLVKTYIPLVELTINADGRIEKVSNAVRQNFQFQPGFVGEFKLSIPSSLSGSNDVLEISANPGAFAVNRNGQKINLTQVASYALSQEPPKTMLLFIAPGKEPGTGRLDIVPDTERVIIELQGNHTYTRNLALQIPAEKQLHLVASNGDRPHLLGNLTIRGIATPDTENAGDFFLEGLLVEGKLTVLPGNLQRLQIAHSTLVPQAGGLVVQKAEYEIIDADPEDVTLLALLMYSLMLLQRLLRVGLSSNGLSTQERISQMSQIVLQQVSTLFAGIQRVIEQLQPPSPVYEDEESPQPRHSCTVCQEPDDDDVNLDEDNSLLAIAIHQSICGAIALVDTVPELRITDSIIDAGEDSNHGAIAALGADVDVKTSTILGAVTVRSLEAEESIFRNQVSVLRRQVGCLRFCYVPQGSRTPRRFRCQPDLILSERIKEPPAAIATLSVDPAGQVYAGTRGNGVFQLLEEGVWIPLNAELSNLNVTALPATAIPGTGSISSTPASPNIVTGINTLFTQELRSGDWITAEGQNRMVQEIISDQQIKLDAPFNPPLPNDGKPFTIHTLFAGRADGTLLRATSTLRSGIGTLSSTGLDAENLVAVTGCNTFFQEQVAAGRIITIADQQRTVQRIASNTLLYIDTAFDRTVTGEEFLITNPTNGTTTAGTGKVSSTRDRTMVTGCNTRLTQEVLLGDDIIIVNQLPTGEENIQRRTVVAIASDNVLSVNTAFNADFVNSFKIRRTVWTPITPNLTNTRINALIPYTMGTGTIASVGDTVTGQQTLFKTEFTVGDIITVTGVKTQTRKVTEIVSNTELKVHAPFDADLTPGTSFQVMGILMGTSGNGVFRSTDGGRQWVAVNQGLTNLDVRAIAHHPLTSYLFVGTHGNGVFRSTDHGMTWTGGDPLDPEIRQTGLTFPNITCLTINPITDDIFAGTEGGGVFCSSDFGQRWMPANDGLSHSTITALSSFAQNGTGTLSSRYTQVTGIDTRFHTELREGDTLTINGQTRTIIQIHADNDLIINDAFDPDLPEGTTFKIATLYAGASEGTIYRSTSNGKTWEAIAHLTDTDISAFAVQQQAPRPVLFAGTQLGSLYRQEESDRWIALNQGIQGVEETLLLLNQMQPCFTTEQYGQPAYTQLSTICPVEICTGAEDGSEMGVFHYLKQPQRQANLQASLQEYLRFGLQADIIYIT
ncbi:exo-alpha-sialidase [Nostoc sp. MG11]|uniref:exo-alpha-sialidase n=1 Tax=Nostoc sp. MG11 TaxID=2721166 RepID=UPI001865CBE2|nr:exo-alpha-sialidase [Nostoc sp. MG11]